MEFDKLLEESLSSDEETLTRIEPRNKRKYALCDRADDTKAFESQKFEENANNDNANLVYMSKQILPALKKIIPYVLAKNSADPKVHILTMVQRMRQKRIMQLSTESHLLAETKLKLNQNLANPYIETSTDLDTYAELLKRRNELQILMNLKT